MCGFAFSIVTIQIVIWGQEIRLSVFTCFSAITVGGSVCHPQFSVMLNSNEVQQLCEDRSAFQVLLSLCSQC